jgi:hypothetical protein
MRRNLLMDVPQIAVNEMSFACYSQWRPIMKRFVSVAIPAKFTSKASGVIAMTIVAAFLFATAVNADDYATAVSVVASPLVNRQEDLDKVYSDAQVMLRMELARQCLQSVSGGVDLAGRRKDILIHLDSCHRSMEEIRRINGNVPDLEKIAKKALGASPALLRSDPETGNLTKEDSRAVNDLIGTVALEGVKLIADAWNASTERDNYRNHYRQVRKEALSLADVAKKRCTAQPPVAYGVGIAVRVTDAAVVIDEAIAGSPAAKAGLRKGDMIVAVNGKNVRKTDADGASIDHRVLSALRRARETTVRLTYLRDGTQKTIELPRSYAYKPDILNIDLDGSWNATFPHDGLALRNISGGEITRCTLRVTMVGTHGDSDSLVREQHLHYIDHWPADAWRYARYRSSSADGIASDESIDRIRGLVIELYADQFQDAVEYDYTGTTAYEADIGRYVSLIEKQQRFTPSYFADTILSDVGVTVRHDGMFTFLPEPTFTVTLRSGKDVRSIVWKGSGKHWDTGLLSAVSLSHPSFNGMKPDRIEIDMQFPGAPKKTSLSWNLISR